MNIAVKQLDEEGVELKLNVPLLHFWAACCFFGTVSDAPDLTAELSVCI